MSVKHALDVTRNHPDLPKNSEPLQELLRACAACLISCNSCSDACLTHGMAGCVRTCRTHAAICTATLEVLTQVGNTHNGVKAAQVRACLESASVCKTECEQHDHAHCATCAEICGWCVEACTAWLDTNG